MSNGSLDAVRLARALRSAAELETLADQSLRHVRVLRDSGRSFDARTLLDQASALALRVRDFDDWLRELDGHVRTLSRSIDRRPPRELRPGASGSNIAGVIAQARPAVERARRKLDELARAVEALSREAQRRMNEPGRWGSAAASTPLTEFINLLNRLLKLCALVLEQR